MQDRNRGTIPATILAAALGLAWPDPVICSDHSGDVLVAGYSPQS